MNRPLKSRNSKSKYLRVYLYFIEFSDPEDINYEEIAYETNLPVHTVRSLSRPAKNEASIADALLDVGVRARDIPSWFAASNTLKRMRKNAKKTSKEVQARVIPRIERESPHEHPESNYLNLPNVVRTPEEVEDARIRDSIQAQVAVYNRAREEAIQIISWKIYQAREEEKREKQKEQDNKDLMTRMNARVLYYTLMQNFQFNQMMYAWIMSQPLHPPANPTLEILEIIEDLFDVIKNFIKQLNKRKQISNVNHELQSLGSRDWTDLNDQIKEILDNEPSLAENIQAVLELMNEIQEKDRRIKYAKYGNLIKPPEIIWPPGFEPIELFYGPRGEQIKKRINLDHLR